MILIYFIVFYCVSINENHCERCSRHPGYPKVRQNRYLNEIFVTIGSTKCDIAKAKLTGLRNQGRAKLYSLRSKFKSKWCFINAIDDFEIFLHTSCYFLRDGLTQGSLMNRDLLLLQGVHPNPGPHNDSTGMEIIKFITYNCRGLRNINKLRRLLDKIGKLVNKGAIVALQETHKVDVKIMGEIWKHKYLMNCSSTDQRGVMTLFNNKYDLISHYVDSEDRIAIVNVKSESQHLIIANVYCPNDHRESIDTVENLYHNLLKLKYDSPEGHVVLMGDLNACLTSGDHLNRSSQRQEQILVNNIVDNNKMMKLEDSYRYIRQEGGFTWNRGKCFSRLDYIFVSQPMLRFVLDCKTDWAFDQSDHAAVSLEISLPASKNIGPGIIRVNTAVMENSKLLEQIKVNLRLYLSQAPIDWNPNTKLEFLKVGILTTFSEAAKQDNISKRCENEMIEGEINHLINLKIKTTKNQGLSSGDMSRKLETIDFAISQIQAKQQLVSTKYSEDLAKKARIKWYELGEKSNKYFLGLLKLRQSQKYIGEIICEGVKYFGQKAIEEGVKKFYSNLYEKVNSFVNSDISENDDFYKHCPKLNSDQREYVDAPLTVEEITKALQSCKESSPGPDGIPYSVYKALWEISAPIIMESWKYSLINGVLPQSHLDSIITLLPKEGKDTRDIKNWRPITLANCDSKIITKALANRVSVVLESIIEKSQTAYIPGRSVMDNIRSNFLIRSYCKRKNLDSLLISLDAKKAFDSVSHDYICKTLQEYGFGNHFIASFKTLYNNLSAEILVNGFKTGKINIRRGVKQGDALSCALFIKCIDPLLRNVNNNNRIKGIEVISGGKCPMTFKINGYADDIAVITTRDQDSIDQIFLEYERLSIQSGLELNADKTEIIQLHSPTNNSRAVKIKYLDREYTIELVDKLKICGVYYANDSSTEYKLNVSEKIDKLKNQLKKWMVRHLTLEGKVLIVKTFGLSQLIYNMQCYDFNDESLLQIERLIFKFLWSKKWDDHKKCTERIKCSILKNDYDKGGVRAPDVESLNRALKLKQFLRSSISGHPVSYLQGSVLNDIHYTRQINQEYSRIYKDEAVIRVGQETINILSDYSRNLDYGGLERASTMKNAIDMAGSICIKEYLERKNLKLLSCLYNPIKNQSVLTIGNLLIEREIGQLPNHESIINNIIKVFHENIIQIATNYNENINNYESNKVFFLDNSDELKEANLFSVRELQVLLKIATNKVESLNVNVRNDLENLEFDYNHIIRFRTQCKNTKLRSIFHRLLNKDFFHGLKLHRFKIKDNPNCERCNMVEDSKHLLFECEHSRRMWRNYNTIMLEMLPSPKSINRFEDIYDFSGSRIENIIKIKLIQETIQIIRPTNWSESKLRNIIKAQKQLIFI